MWRIENLLSLSKWSTNILLIKPRFKDINLQNKTILQSSIHVVAMDVGHTEDILCCMYKQHLYLVADTQVLCNCNA